MSTGYDVSRCADGSVYSSICVAGFFDSGYNRYEEGSDIGKLVPCCPGYYCSRTTTCLQPCSAGALCVVGEWYAPTGRCEPYDTFHYVDNSKNVTCGGAGTNFPCPAGGFCERTDVVPEVCPPGHFCNGGLVEPKTCTSIWPGDHCAEGSTYDHVHQQTVINLFLIAVVIVAIYVTEERLVQTLCYHLPPPSQGPTHDKGVFVQRTDLVVTSITLDDVRVWREGNLSFAIDFLDRRRRVRFHQGVTAIVGLSGAGKSTLFDTLAGNITSYHTLSGQVRYSKRLPGQRKAMITEYDAFVNMYGYRIAYVWQRDTFHEPLTVYETLLFSAKMRTNFTVAECESVVTYWIHRLQLQRETHKRTSKLSGGQRKRVNVAMELVTDPLVLILDEPTSGLDTNTTEVLMEALHLFAQGRGVTSAASASLAPAQATRSMTSRSFDAALEGAPSLRQSRVPRLVLAVLHQPSYEVALSFDRIIGVQARRLTLPDGRSFKVGKLDLPPKLLAPKSTIVGLTARRLTRALSSVSAAEGTALKPLVAAEERIVTDPERYLSSNSRVQAVRPHRQNDMDNYLMSFLEPPDPDEAAADADDARSATTAPTAAANTDGDADDVDPRTRMQRQRSYCVDDGAERAALQVLVEEIPHGGASWWRFLPRYDTVSATTIYQGDPATQWDLCFGFFRYVRPSKNTVPRLLGQVLTFLKHYQVGASRSLALTLHKWDVFAVNASLALCLGYALGIFNTRMDQNPQKVASCAFLMILAMSLICLQTGLQTRMSTKVANERESRRGVHSVAVYLGESLVEMLWLLAAPALFLLLFFPNANPRGSFTAYYCVNLAVAFTSASVGHVLAEQSLWQEPAPIGIYLNLFFALLAGFIPTKRTLAPGLTEWSFLSFAFQALIKAEFGAYTPVMYTAGQTWLYNYEPQCHRNHARDANAISDSPSVYIDCDLHCPFSSCVLSYLLAVVAWGILFRWVVLLMMAGYTVGVRDRLIFAVRRARQEVLREHHDALDCGAQLWIGCRQLWLALGFVWTALTSTEESRTNSKRREQRVRKLQKGAKKSSADFSEHSVPDDDSDQDKTPLLASSIDSPKPQWQLRLELLARRGADDASLVMASIPEDADEDENENAQSIADDDELNTDLVYIRELADRRVRGRTVETAGFINVDTQSPMHEGGVSETA